MDKEVLKLKYKRNNASEQKVLETIVNNVPNLIIFNSYNSKTIIERRIEMTKNLNRLFINAETSNITECGYNTKIEFLLVTTTNKWIWFDAKHLNKKGSRIVNTLFNEFEQAKKCKGKFIFAFFGDGYTDKQLKIYNQYLCEIHANNVLVTKDIIPILCNNFK